jgi:hypothetical protein
MERLAGDLRAELRRLGPPDDADLAAIVVAWPELAGETVVRNAWPLRVGGDRTLHVATASSTWAYELGRLAPELLARFRERLGEAAPASLRFAPGPLPAALDVPAEQRPQPVEPAPDDRAAAAELAASIADEHLRDLVARAAAASLARARSGRRF